MKPSTVAASIVIASSIFSSLASASVTIDWVTVGNAGNAADPLTGYGAVAYEYKIGKYEVTNAQYGAFLNAAAKTDSYGLYNSNMSTYGITRSGSSGSYNYSVTGALANRPVVYVSWFDAARFANWMMNSQGDGSTETGAYTLLGATSGAITKNTEAQVYIPTENEWYKAAYYDPQKALLGAYWLYANRSDSLVSNRIGDPGAANYFHFAYAVTGSTAWSTDTVDTSDVGAYGSISTSYYGTYDQLGNVREINDEIENEKVGVRGGSFASRIYLETDMNSTTQLRFMESTGESGDIGFRLAAVPEPSSMLLTILTGGVMLIRRKR
jgi:formylglycine-generating enzyme required for sulfatase activity